MPINVRQVQEINKLILGDNLEILRGIESETIDLIYLDPPFFSNRNYEVIWGDKGEVRSFEDRFSGGIDHYIAWLKERVFEMHRILKKTGSIYLHCDYHANAYIKVYVLDSIFGANNFRNEIIWCYTGPSASKKAFPMKHDTIWRYSKSENFVFNIEDIRVPYKKSNLTTGRTALAGRADDSVLLELDERGKVPEDFWNDIPSGSHISKLERIGYPTQKPLKLLERIIKASSNKDDIILDPFVGGGTTVAMADKLERRWIGIDQSVAAVKVTEMRMQNQQDLFSKPFITQLHKYDYDTLRYKDAFEFESFIVVQFGGTNNTKQRGDLGLDGKTRDNTPIQVKRSDNIGRNVVDNFLSAVKRNDKNLYEKNKAELKPVGFIIAFSFGKGAVQEVARLKNEENVIIKLVAVEEIIPIAKKPKLSVEIKDIGTDEKGLREIEFKAKGESDAGIEFYMWDFDYKDEKFNADIMFDKNGQHTQKFKAGTYSVAVKVVDNEGLESIEIIKLKINGKVERE